MRNEEQKEKDKMYHKNKWKLRTEEQKEKDKIYQKNRREEKRTLEHKEKRISFTPEQKILHKQEWRMNNKEKIKQSKKKGMMRKKLFISDFKRDKCCSNCGYKEYPEILQFHHNKGKKEFEISDSEKLGYPKIKTEMERCILLCPNCHFLLHYKERLGKV